MGLIISGKNGSRWQSEEEGEQNSDQISFWCKTPEKNVLSFTEAEGKEIKAG